MRIGGEDLADELLEYGVTRWGLSAIEDVALGECGKEASDVIDLFFWDGSQIIDVDATT